MAGEPGLEYYSYAATNIKSEYPRVTVLEKDRITQEEAESRDSYIVVTRDKNERIATIKQILNPRCGIQRIGYKEDGESIFSKKEKCQPENIDSIHENEDETSLYTDYYFLANVKPEKRISREAIKKGWGMDYYVIKRDEKARILSVTSARKSDCWNRYSYEYKENGDILSFANFKCKLEDVQDDGLEYYRVLYSDYRFLVIPENGSKITREQAKKQAKYSIVKRDDAARTLLIKSVWKKRCGFNYSYEYDDEGKLISDGPQWTRKEECGLEE